MRCYRKLGFTETCQIKRQAFRDRVLCRMGWCACLASDEHDGDVIVVAPKTRERLVTASSHLAVVIFSDGVHFYKMYSSFCPFCRHEICGCRLYWRPRFVLACWAAWLGQYPNASKATTSTTTTRLSEGGVRELMASQRPLHASLLNGMCCHSANASATGESSATHRVVSPQEGEEDHQDNQQESHRFHGMP